MMKKNEGCNKPYEWLHGTEVEIEYLDKGRKPKTRYSILVGGLLLSAAFLVLPACSKDNAVTDTPQSSEIQQVIDYEFEALKQTVQTLETQYNLSNAVTDEQLQAAITHAKALREKVEAEIALKLNEDYKALAFKAVEVVDDVGIIDTDSYYGARNNVYDLAELFGLEHQPKKEVAQAEANRLKAEADAKATEEAKAQADAQAQANNKKPSSGGSSGGGTKAPAKKPSSGGSGGGNKAPAQKPAQKPAGGNSGGGGIKEDGGNPGIKNETPAEKDVRLRRQWHRTRCSKDGCKRPYEKQYCPF